MTSAPAPAQSAHPIEARRLDKQGCHNLEFLEAQPRGAEPSEAPLLFVHGAFAGAWCWDELFLPFFAGRGRHVGAVSLRGHGASSGGGPELRQAGLHQYTQDVLRGIDALPSPPVVVGHSLGGYLAQLLIGRVKMRGLILLGSLPPDGMALIGPRLAMTDTLIWTEAVSATVTDSKGMIDAAGLQILFGEGVPPDRARRYGARLIPESPRALAEAHLLRPVLSAMTVSLPTLVLHGALDRLVWPIEALRSASYHQGEYDIVAEGGHFLMLDPVAEGVALRISDWLAARGL